MRYRFFRDSESMVNLDVEIERGDFTNSNIIGGKVKTLYDPAMELIFFERELNFQIPIGYEIHPTFYPKDYPDLWVNPHHYLMVSRAIVYPYHISIELK